MRVLPLPRTFPHWAELPADFKQGTYLVGLYLTEPFCFPDIKVALLFRLVLFDPAVLTCLILPDYAFLFLIVNPGLSQLFMISGNTNSPTTTVIPTTGPPIFQKDETVPS